VKKPTDAAISPPAMRTIANRFTVMR
jgi:hypothetical protein